MARLLQGWGVKLLASICLYFHVHQPFRLKQFNVFGKRGHCLRSAYFSEEVNKHYFEKAARQCYLPANKVLLDAIEETGGAFKASFSITGTFVEQARLFVPEVLDSFRALAETGCVEFVGETWGHSLAVLYADSGEFREQVRMHSRMLRDEFGARPSVFRNTELIYSNDVGREARAMGFGAVLAEGFETVLGWRSANFVYRARNNGPKLLFRNYRLSDDVGYRFGARWWSQWPLTADKYASWLASAEGDTVNLFMDYETFGEHHWPGSGIFGFLKHLPRECRKRGLEFLSVGETASRYSAVDEVDVPFALSWADLERDVSAWLGNKLQRACFAELESLKPLVESAVAVEGGESGRELLDVYRRLQTSDHLYYLCTKSWADGDVHKHFSPYKESSPYENFINYMNVLQDFKEEVCRRAQASAASVVGAKSVEGIALKEGLV